MPEDSKQFKNCSVLSDVVIVISREDSSGVDAILAVLREKRGPRTVQEAVRLLRVLLSGQVVRAKSESMRSWCNRFEHAVTRTGKALHAVDSTVTVDQFLHPLILGILLLQGSLLEVREEVGVLATSGTEGNSDLITDVASSLQKQWSDEAIVRRDAKTYSKQPTATAPAFGLTGDDPAPYVPEADPEAELLSRVDHLQEMVGVMAAGELPGGGFPGSEYGDGATDWGYGYPPPER